jgi:hypothetical protein
MKLRLVNSLHYRVHAQEIDKAVNALAATTQKTADDFGSGNYTAVVRVSQLGGRRAWFVCSWYCGQRVAIL